MGGKARRKETTRKMGGHEPSGSIKYWEVLE
jgi:hypothetical protein